MDALNEGNQSEATQTANAAGLTPRPDLVKSLKTPGCFVVVVVVVVFFLLFFNSRKVKKKKLDNRGSRKFVFSVKSNLRKLD